MHLSTKITQAAFADRKFWQRESTRTRTRMQRVERDPVRQNYTDGEGSRALTKSKVGCFLGKMMKVYIGSLFTNETESPASLLRCCLLAILEECLIYVS